MSLIHAIRPAASLRHALCIAGALMFAAQALAADRTIPAAAQAAYKRDRAECMSGKSGEDRAVCLREAGAAREEAKRGGLSNEQTQFERNRLLRCDSQPPQDRGDCIRRMSGEARTSGSVEGGGIYRELVTPVEVPTRK